MELISIIVPVYNVEKYLETCVMSVIGQTYKNIEIILVDDGSTDHSGKLCDEFAIKDNRIRAIHKQNGGLGSARNAGIEAAKGNYYAFIDSDDYVQNEFIEVLYDNMINKDADISECSFSYLKDGKMRQARLFGYDVLDNKTAVKRLFAPPFQSFEMAWNKLYKKELFQRIRFPEVRAHEDTCVIYRLLYESRRIAYVNQNLYVYLIRENSIMTSGYSREKADVLLKYLRDQRDFFKSCDIDLDEELSFREYSVWSGLLNVMAESDCYDEKIWNNVRDSIRRNRRKLFQLPYLRNGRSKLWIIMMLIGRRTYLFYWRMTKAIKRKVHLEI